MRAKQAAVGEMNAETGKEKMSAGDVIDGKRQREAKEKRALTGQADTARDPAPND